MNAFSADEFGDLGPLLRALGLVSATGQFNGDWITDPQDYLSQMLADDQQREALLEFVGTVLDSGIERDPEGRQWVQLFTDQVKPGVEAGFFLVLDDAPPGWVNIFLGLRLTTGGAFAESVTSLLFPLFRADKTAGPSPDTPLLAGSPGGIIAVSSEITVGPPPASGGAGLARIGLRVAVPTDGTDTDLDIGLTLGGLQLPGETSPRDLVLSLNDPDALQETATDLILALIEAQLRGSGGAQVRALAEALGLGGVPEIPAFPASDLAERGAEALAEWVAQLLGTPVARARWIEALADLLGGGATANASGIDLPVGGAVVRIGLRAEDGATGRPDITVSVSFSLVEGIAAAGVAVDILRLSLATGAAVAVPQLDASLRFDMSGLVTPDVSLDTLILGFGFDEDRRPKVIIAAQNATVGSSTHPWLDLTNPDALAAAAAQTVTDLLGELLAQLGPGASLIGTALGWTAPQGASVGYPLIDPVTFLGDPLGRLRAHWAEVLDSHAADIPAVLSSLRRLLTGAPETSGSGTAAEPWLLSINPGAHVAIWRDDQGALCIGLGFLRRVEELGDRCTVIEFRGRMCLLKVDLGSGATAFLPEIMASFIGRARGGGRVETGIAGLTLETDRIGLQALWRPNAGLSVTFDAPSPTIALDGIDLNLDLPDFSSGLDASLFTPAQWDGLERLMGLLADRSEQPFLADFVDMLGWRRLNPILGGPDPHRLALRKLIDTPEATLRTWLGALLADRQADVLARLNVLAARIGGGGQGVSGDGSLSNPWRLALPGTETGPALAAWRMPDYTEAEPRRFASIPLRDWAPGNPGLEADEMARAMASEMPTLLGGLGSAGLRVGLGALADLWTGTDGLVPPTVSAGTATLHVVEDVDGGSLIEMADAEPFLGAAPPVLFVVRTLSDTDPTPDGTFTERLIDLRSRGHEATAFPQVPPDASGVWTILIAPRPETQEGDVAGQAARLAHALAPAGGIAGAAVLADRASGHGAWLALNQLPGGPDRLLIAGLAAAPVPPLDPQLAETLQRLDELLPQEDPAEPDDADLARGRRMIRDRLSGRPLAELAPPPGWTGGARAGLEVRLLQGSLGRETVMRAMTAVVAAGLSTYATARAGVLRNAAVASVGAGIAIPLGETPGDGVLGFSGRAMVELLSASLARNNSLQAEPSFRQASKVTLSGQISRGNGWLVGGPTEAGDAPLALRSISISACLGLGGTTETGVDGLQIILHGARLFGQSHARLVLTPDELQTPGIPRVAPTSPAVRALLAQLFAEIDAGPAIPSLSDLLSLLRGMGVVGADASFDALSLSHWIDDPTAQLQTALANPATADELTALVSATLAGTGAGLNYDAGRGELTVAMSGAAPDMLLGGWSVDAVLKRTGVVSGALSFGAEGSPGLQVGLSPFTAAIILPGTAQTALPDVPGTIPLWPSANPGALLDHLPPTLAAAALSQMLQGLREIDSTVQTIVDTGLAAFGLSPDPVRVPPQLFTDPRGWFIREGVLGGPGGSVNPARVIAVMDALRPLVGAGGGSGIWEIVPGLALRARDMGGLVLDLAMDAGAFLPGDAIALGGSFGLSFPPGPGQSRPEIALFAGLPDAAEGREAVHLTVSGTQLSLFMRPPAGADVEIYPGPPNLGNLLATALSAALPRVLDAIVDDGPAEVAALLADVGDALALRVGGNFDGPALVAWADDPVASLSANWPQLVSTGLGALGPVMPTGITVTTPATGVRVEVANAGTPGSTLSAEFFAATRAIAFGADLTGIPFVGAVTASLSVDETGLDRLPAMIGPAEIPLADGLVLRPLIALDVGREAPPSTISTGLALDPDADQSVDLRYNFATESFAVSVGGDTPAEIAAGLMHLAVELLGGFVMSLDPVNDLLDEDFGNTTVRGLLEGVILRVGPGGGLDVDFFRALPAPGETAPALLQSKLDRLLTLVRNIAEAEPSIRIDNAVEIGISEDGGVVGLRLAVIDRLEIIGGDVAIWLENDSRWIVPDTDPGLDIRFLNTAGGISFAPALSVNGLGLRIGSSNAPLIKSPLSLGSIAVHGFGRVGNGPTRGGVQIELAEIGAAVTGGSSDNAVASGLLSETNDGNAALAPAFSPALSVQNTEAGGLRFGFRAGDGEGPWWLPIRKGFGPLYVEQIGLGAQSDESTGLQSVSLLFDGSVSIAGLSASVDELELIYRTDRGGIFDADSWGADLAGLGVSADLSGISLAGGLRKFGEAPDIEYIGMLAARFAVYGLSIYGGYASASDNEGRYTAFFAVGSFLGPIGGAPAFFITGVGGGFGINRDLVPPTDLGDFGDFVLIQALDPAADLPTDVTAYLEEVRQTFPAIRGKFWFAAGISFTSFALVDGIAVVAVEFGSGFELSIFGLARMALPRPGFALVSIELGLLARFSTEEGVIWIQAQLTDNSWLLHESARLTGGFAYVSWFKGPNAGEFVLTLGGYHPSFSAEGYPVVPRLGYNWSVSNNILIKGENYFALTSEAIMGGGGFEATAKFGPVFVSLAWGVDAIVYFDPFKYLASAYVRISAGIRIKTWFGTIKLSFSLSAEIEVAGPEFHGRARVKIGPIDVTVKFGKQDNPEPAYVSWTDFAAKYLELANDNRAEALTGIAGRGSLPPASGDGEPSETRDGTQAKPYDVMSEFELSFTSTIPLTRIIRGTSSPIERDPSGVLGVAPANLDVEEITLQMSLRKIGEDGSPERLDNVQIKLRTRDTGAFPLGVWGPPPSHDDKKVPKGAVVKATEGVDLTFTSAFLGLRPDLSTGGVAFNQIEAGPRKPLPLRDVGAFFGGIAQLASTHLTLLGSIDDDSSARIAAELLTEERLPVGATGARAARRAQRTPLRIGLLTERVVVDVAAGEKGVIDKVVVPRPDIPFGRSRLRGQLNLPTIARDEAAGSFAPRITRVTPEAARGAVRRAPPVLKQVLASRRNKAPAFLLRSALAATPINGTLGAAARVRRTLPAGLHASASAARATAGTRAHLAGIAEMAGAEPLRGARAEASVQGLTAGEVAVFDLPGAAASRRFGDAGQLTLSGPARVLALGFNGRVRLDDTGPGRTVTLPRGTATYAVIAGEDGSAAADVRGWSEAQSVAYLGRSLALCRGGLLRAEGGSRVRGGRAGGTGWIRAGHLTDQSALVETRFERAAASVAVFLEGAVTPDELSDLAISFTRAVPQGKRPLIVPYDHKTLILYDLKSEPGFAVRLAGLTHGRLDGVMAADLASERLATRLINESVSLSVSLVRASTNPLKFNWRRPADVTPRTAPVEPELEEL